METAPLLEDRHRLRKLIVAPLVKTFPIFHGTPRFITVFKTALCVPYPKIIDSRPYPIVTSMPRSS
jgi:hypothetical protein